MDESKKMCVFHLELHSHRLKPLRNQGFLYDTLCGVRF